jgi:hypothetical protein
VEQRGVTVTDLATLDTALDTEIDQKDLLRNSNGTLVLPADDEDDELPQGRGPELSTMRSHVKFQNKIIRQCLKKKIDKGTALALVAMSKTVFDELHVLDHSMPLEERVTRLEESRSFAP